MNDAEEMGFTKRQVGKSIKFTLPSRGLHIPSTKAITACANVTLKLGDDRVLIENLRASSRERFTGKITGFEPSGLLELNGIKIGEEINFTEMHVFTAEAME